MMRSHEASLALSCNRAKREGESSARWSLNRRRLGPALGTFFALAGLLSCAPVLGQISFDAPELIPWHTPGSGAQYTKSVDLDGDGRLDLIISRPPAHVIDVLIGNGDGTFDAPVSYATAALPVEAADVADLNGDGYLDAAVACHDANAVTVLFGGPGGTFSGRVDLPVDAMPLHVTIGKFGPNGEKGIAAACWSGSVSVWVGDGSGSFSPRPSIGCGGGPQQVRAAAFDSDGFDDLAVSVWTTDTLLVLRGQGDGTFAGVSSYGVPGHSYVISVADLNSDSKLDIVATAANSPAVTDGVAVLLGNNDCTFAASYYFGCPAGPHVYYNVIADFDADGKPDIAVTTNYPDPNSPLGFAVLRNVGGGQFEWTGPFQYDSFSGVCGGDFTGDGLPDLVTADGNSGTVRLIVNTTPVSSDQTAPTTVANSSPAPNPAGWHNTNVTIALTATDNAGGSGVRDITYTLSGAQTGGATITGSTANLTITAEGTTTVTFYATDNAGNTEPTQSITIKLDKTDPTINASVSPNPIVLNGAATATVGATDTLSGVASESGGGPVDTSSVGTKSVTVSAADVAGNPRSQTVSYVVTYGVNVLFDQSKAYKNSVPIKIQLVDANGSNVSSTSVEVRTVSVVQISSTANGEVEEEYSTFDTGFTFDPKMGDTFGYRYNLRVKDYPTGTYRLRFTAAGDPVVHSVEFKVK